jgi:multidrug efflux pump subunit AcrA (membrane-fusion protein)
MLARKVSKISFGMVMIAAFFIGACSALPSQETPTEEPVEFDDSPPIVSATGIVVPSEFTTLSMTTAGVVNDVHVYEGDQVNKDQVLVRLKGKEELQAAISAAEFEVVSAKKALDDLFDNAEIILASKQEEVALYAREFRNAQYQLDNFTVPQNQKDLETMEAFDLMKERLDRAREAFEPYRYRSSNNETREDRKEDLEEAQSDYDSALKRLEYENVVKVAKANLERAREDFELYRDGPDPAELKLAESRLNNANASLNAAQSALEDLELTSRFDGTTSEVYVHAGEWVTPGQPIILLADQSNLLVETTDLNEIDAARVNEGDKVIVTFDALPEVVINGTVDKIATKASPGTGVNYKVVIILDEIPEQLRWDMTAFVDIQVE